MIPRATLRGIESHATPGRSIQSVPNDLTIGTGTRVPAKYQVPERRCGPFGLVYTRCVLTFPVASGGLMLGYIAHNNYDCYATVDSDLVRSTISLFKYRATGGL